MDLKEEQSQLTPEYMQDYIRIFHLNKFDPKNNEEPQLINSKNDENEIKGENINESEKKSTNDSKNEIDISNENVYKLETSIENNLQNPETKNYILFQSNNIVKKLFIIDNSNVPNINSKNNSLLSNKRGRPKKSNDRREHTKYDKYNIKKKLNGLFIKAPLSFINEKIHDRRKKLKPLSYEETNNLKKNMNKKIKDILENVSTRYCKNCNKNSISAYEPILKEIFEIPMYKIIHHISGNYIGILGGLEEKYLILKNKKLEKEKEDYKKLFNKIEAKFLNLIKVKYPINDEITKDNSIHQESNFDLNFGFTNKFNMEEIDQISLEMGDSLNNNNLSNSDLFTILPNNASSEEKDDILSFSEC